MQRLLTLYNRSGAMTPMLTCLHAAWVLVFALWLLSVFPVDLRLHACSLQL